MKTLLRTLIFIVIISSLVCMTCSCLPSNAPSSDNDNINGEKVYNECSFISIEEGKQLFAESFSPLIPNVVTNKTARYDIYIALDEPFNYVLTLDSSFSLENKEKKRFDGYSLTYSYPLILDDFASYNINEEDLMGWVNAPVWIDEDYLINKLSTVENGDELAKGLSDLIFSQINKNYLPSNLLLLNNMYINNERISFVQFNAYSDSLDGKKYPKINWSTTTNDLRSGVWALDPIVLDGNAVNVTIYEEIDKLLCENRVTIIEEIPNELSLILGDINNNIVKSFCSVTFTKNGINYEINYPLVYRIVGGEDADFSVLTESDREKINNIARKTALHFVGLLE